MSEPSGERGPSGPGPNGPVPEAPRAGDAAGGHERAAPSGENPTATITVGTDLPGLDVPVTRTLIVAGAMASRDFEPVHHDHLVAEERGSADVFVNILTTNGLVGRFVTDWAGPGARIRAIDIRLGVPAYPGDTLSFSGRVVDVVEAGDAGAGRVTVDVRAANGRGDHATGTVEVDLT